MDPLASFAFFLGTWTCNGVFPATGKTIASTLTFSVDLAGKAIVKHHDDVPPSSYHAVEYWVYSDTDKRYNAAVVDSSGGVRDFITQGWNGDMLMWSTAPWVIPPQEFNYKKISAKSFSLEWRIAENGVFVLGDKLTCMQGAPGTNPGT